jgi:hypothetical protein
VPGILKCTKTILPEINPKPYFFYLYLWDRNIFLDNGSPGPGSNLRLELNVGQLLDRPANNIFLNFYDYITEHCYKLSLLSKNYYLVSNQEAVGLLEASRNA